MNEYLAQVSAAARNAAYSRDWATVNVCAKEILKKDSRSPEGFFLAGLVEKASQRPFEAANAFAKALELDSDRYDAAIELANLHRASRRNGDAAALLATHVDKLNNSPLYLNMAGAVYAGIGMPEEAWPLYQKANELQPGVDLFQANIATCAMFLGKIDEATKIYTNLLEKYPTHQRYHYQIAQLRKAADATHIDLMKEILHSTNMSPDKNIFMYYAIGKELEDLNEWEEAFRYFKLAGDAVASVADYDINADLQLIDKIAEVCHAGWLQDGEIECEPDSAEKTPIFIVGLPRSGTTLTERILASHSNIQSVDETQFMQMVIRREAGIESSLKMTPEMIEAAAKLDIGTIGNGYMDMLRYRLGKEPMFVDKLPFNILYLGFISKAFPNARIVHVKRNPMDSCFSMYKQVFTGAYKFSYTLAELGRFYVSYTKLVNHWIETIGERIVEIEYENLVTDQENQTKMLLNRIGLEFEKSCLDFDQNVSATLTASAVQVREKVHARSVNRWKKFATHLQPLRDYLEKAGIVVE